MTHEFNFCPHCATPLQRLSATEDGGPKIRLRCVACGWTHWNNPTPVLAAIVEMVEHEGRILLARNAAWPGKMFALITGFMEADDTPAGGIVREVLEETNLCVEAPTLVGVYDFQRMNQIIVAYHVLARGDVVLSPELAEYRLFRPEEIKCWRGGTGYALADWLTGRGIEPRWADQPVTVKP